jgi:hypothetical protein
LKLTNCLEGIVSGNVASADDREKPSPVKGTTEGICKIQVTRLSGLFGCEHDEYATIVTRRSPASRLGLLHSVEHSDLTVKGRAKVR